MHHISTTNTDIISQWDSQCNFLKIAIEFLPQLRWDKLPQTFVQIIKERNDKKFEPLQFASLGRYGYKVKIWNECLIINKQYWSENAQFWTRAAFFFSFISFGLFTLVAVCTKKYFAWTTFLDILWMLFFLFIVIISRSILIILSIFFPPTVQIRLVVHNWIWWYDTRWFSAQIKRKIICKH